MIAIKTDIRTYSEKTKDWGFHGKKSGRQDIELDDLVTLMEREHYSGIHELLVGDAYKPYSDLDLSVDESITLKSFQELNNEKIVKAYECMASLFPMGNVVVFCASSFAARKISAHFIVNQMYYKQKEHIKHVMKRCDAKALHFDESVYCTNKLMRIPLCSKPGQNRPLVQVSISAGKIELLPNFDVETDLIEGLITYISADDIEMPAPADYVEPVPRDKIADVPLINWTPEQKQKNFEKTEKLINAIGSTRASSYSSWSIGVLAIRKLAEYYGCQGSFRALAQNFATKTNCDNYNEINTDTKYMSVDELQNIDAEVLDIWADRDTPNWNLVALETDVLTFYDKKHELLAAEPVLLDVQNWMMGCLRYCALRGKEEWFQHSTDGWYTIENKANFPFGTISSNSKFDKSSFKDILVELKDSLPFQSCITEGAHFYPFFGVSDRPKIINLFRGWPHTVSASSDTHPAAQLFVNHVMMLCGEAPGKYFLDTITRKLRFPREKGKFMILYGRFGGEGKNALQDILTAVFGGRHCLSSSGTKSILGQGEAGFNAQAEPAILFFIQEAKADGKSIVCDEKFKTWLTEPTQQIRRMRCDPYEAPNYGNAILFTNNSSCIKMTAPMARRSMAVEVSDAKSGDKAYFDPLWAISKDSVASAGVFNFLVNRDISEVNFDAVPQTAFMDSMKSDSFSTIHRFIIDACNGERDLVIADGEAFVSKVPFHQDFRNFCIIEGIQQQYVATLRSFTAELEKLGIPCKQKRIDGDRTYCFVVNFAAIQTIFRKVLKNDKWSLIKEECID